MEGPTSLIALLGVIAVLTCRPVYGLAAWILVISFYPDYLRLSLGMVDISAHRIVLTVLLARCLNDASLRRRFRWITLDYLIILSMIVYTFTLAFTVEANTWFVNRAGYLMDTLFVYFAFRLVVVDFDSLLVVVRTCAIAVIPLAIMGLVETFYAKSIYFGLGQYCPFAANKGMEYQERQGLFRAMGPHGETIMFGLWFACLLPLVRLLRFDRPAWRMLRWPAMLACVAGVLSTVSSGPYMALIVVFVCLALERAKYLVKPLIVGTILLCIAIEFLSNRHFYYVLGDLAMDGDSAWYRARLIDVAIMMLPQYWQFGYGFTDPGWGPLIDGNKRSDGVNDYIVHAVVYGIFGLLVYLAVLASAMRNTVRAHAASLGPAGRCCCWAVATSLIGLMMAFWSVSLFGQMEIFFYGLLGLAGALAVIFPRTATAPRPRRPLARGPVGQWTIAYK